MQISFAPVLGLFLLVLDNISATFDVSSNLEHVLFFAFWAIIEENISLEQISRQKSQRFYRKPQFMWISLIFIKLLNTYCDP